MEYFSKMTMMKEHTLEVTIKLKSKNKCDWVNKAVKDASKNLTNNKTSGIEEFPAELIKGSIKGFICLYRYFTIL